jgi:hypothetical protein
VRVLNRLEGIPEIVGNFGWEIRNEDRRYFKDLFVDGITYLVCIGIGIGP